ncbi:tripartite-type tricarboxylate transporter receptor subunit TctC [Chromohalobacter marismortui]|uniref:Tripartite-type tricarboxylate transporter receptor subunit TctC n=1 Tax=Chromohalobacter marismortui TaxID=42055 RepID=A0A4R7NNB2_9GAMM|nr:MULTISPECIES: tripartite tricarboxylate transporter substrate binding protein [Chromohalobacter]MCI0509997.1 tripartite tricarboxylate transporter substrate binding protein [Chromohalobacter sp.]MCI0593286.1 tripartite tricarboxylate transporter substrate binding protein [Chromohalobacter sp.]TDU22102.1 tripartite-type tricarboxylate transporter receptor subunit TctC [Chromohalobacter marismortui]
MVRATSTTMMTAALALWTSLAAAQANEPEACSWQPERAVTFIVPWGTGGGTDANSRRLASLLEEEMGVPFNVVNRTGGNGVVGHTMLARSQPDGYTIGAATVEIDTMHWIGLTPLTYKDITPIALIDRTSAAVLVNQDSPYESLEALLDEARQNPGELTASGTAQGGIWHLALAGMLKAEGLAPDAIRWIPSQGAAPALKELMAGGVDVATPALSEARNLVEQGELKALAYMSDTPMEQMPKVPLTSDILDSGWTMGAFVTVSGPKGLPDEIACAYEQAIDDAVHSKAWAEFKRSRGTPVVFEGRQETAQTLAEADRQLGEVIKAIGLAQ